jgi:hypothetical protein
MVYLAYKSDRLTNIFSITVKKQVLFLEQKRGGQR